MIIEIFLVYLYNIPSDKNVHFDKNWIFLGKIKTSPQNRISGINFTQNCLDIAKYTFGGIDMFWLLRKKLLNLSKTEYRGTYHESRFL